MRSALPATGGPTPRRLLAATRMLAVMAAVGVFAVGVVSPAFRAIEGNLAASFIVPLSVAIWLAFVALFVSRRNAVAMLWLGLAATGQAVALQLMRAGNLIGYQHYVPFDEILAPGNVAVLGFLAAQTALVGIGVMGHVGEMRGWLSRGWGGLRLALVGAVFVLGSATLSRRPDVYVAELIIASLIQLLALLTVVLFAMAVPADSLGTVRRRMDSLLGEPGVGPEPGGPDRFALACAAFVVVVAALLAVLSYQRHPHVPDEVVYLLHGRYFARGMLTMPPPPVPAAFDLDLVTFEPTRWYSPVPPGWPAALAVGAFFGVPWLVNPVLGGLCVLLAYTLLREMYARRTARVALLLLCASPWFLLMSMNFMTHTFTLFAALVAAVATARARRTEHLARAIPAGIALGVMALVRPLEALTVAMMLGLWALVRPGGGLAPATPAVMAMLAAATAAITLPYNRHLSGDATVFPLMAYTDAEYGAGTNALGFGANRGLGWPGLDPLPGHGLPDVLINANQNIYSVNVELLGWGAGSLLLIALLVFSGAMRRADRMMLAMIAAIVGVHSLYWFSGGPDFGARYWYMVLVPCLALSARGLEVVAVRLAGQREVRPWAHDGHTRALLGGAALALIALFVFVPWRGIDKYYHYRGMRPDVRKIARDNDFGRDLVLVRGRRFPDYASAAPYNPIDLDGDVPIYVWDRSPDVRLEALRAYADRAVWIVDGPTETGAGYRLVAGPLRADSMIATAGER